jgi:hypothetical protein
MEEVGLQDGMISTERRGNNVGDCVQAVAAVGKDNKPVACLAGGDYKRLKSGAVTAVEKELIVTSFFEAHAKAPGKRNCVLH